MTDRETIRAFDDDAEAMGETLGDMSDAARAFRGELDKIRGAFSQAGQDAAALERGMSKGLRRAMDGVILDGETLSDALKTVAQSMVNAAYSAAVTPVTKHIGGLFADGASSLVQAALPFAEGGVFSQGRVTPFARGGVVSGPVSFPMRGGVGVMGEAGPEAIMPLARGPDGRLGVRGGGGGGVSVVMNVRTPDVEGFQRSQGQIAAQMSRALSRGNRNR